MTEAEEKRMDDLAALVSEHFTDFLLMLRPSGRSEPSWRCSDPTWAAGAARKYVNYCEMGDRLTQVDDFGRRDY